MDRRYSFWIDRGGTFTDVIGRADDGAETSLKLLSASPAYGDAAVEAMRRILVDHARRRGRAKRSGGRLHLPLDEALALGDEAADPVVLALDEALGVLEAEEPAIARLVEMRFFGGLTQEECAGALGISRRTVCRQWDYAQAWLYRALSADGA